MQRGIYDQYNRTVGYGQMAPGRDLPPIEQPGQPGRPREREVINSAITGGMPAGGVTPFKGAQQTLGGGLGSQLGQGMQQAVARGGYQAPVDPQTTPVQAPAPQQPAAPRQTYAMGGYNAAKMADPNKQTEKYKIGRVLQYHDPSKGITPELLADLNALDIGDFSGQGDKLSVANSRNGSRLVAGMGDIIKNFTGEGPKEWSEFMTGDGREPGAPAPFLAGPASTISTPQGQLNTAIEGLKPQVGSYSEQVRQQLLAMLGQDPELANLLSVLN